jgi:hypothetical protein
MALSSSTVPRNTSSHQRVELSNADLVGLLASILGLCLTAFAVGFTLGQAV